MSPHDRLALIAPILLTALIASDSSAKSVSLGLLSGTTSDKVETLSLTGTYSEFESNLSWPYKDEPPSSHGMLADFTHYTSNNPTYSFQRTDMSVGWIEKVSPRRSWQAQLGFFSRKVSRDRNGTDLTGLVKSSHTDTHSWWLDLQLAVDSIETQVTSFTPNLGKLKAWTGSSTLTWQLDPEYRLSYRGKYSLIKDSNFRQSTDLQLMYGLSTHTPWLWIGFGGEVFNNTEPSTQYWSPRSFYSIGPRLDLSMQINDQWLWLLAFNAYVLKEEDYDPGQGYYLNTGLQYGSRDLRNLRFSWKI